jgi:polygalacturonase
MCLKKMNRKYSQGIKIILAVLLMSGWTLQNTRANGAVQKHVYNVREYGAVSDGKTDNALAIQKAIDACSKAGGGQVLFDGTDSGMGNIFMTGHITVKSNVDLHINGGVRLQANPDPKVYTLSAFRANKAEGTMWISGEHIKNFSITGKGIIDGNGVSFMGAELDDSYALKPFEEVDPRPHVLTLIDGQNIRIHNVQIVNAAYWTIHLVGCGDVVISGVSLINNLKVRNSDGIDIDHSKNVRISDCHIESGDDCICLKNRREYANFGRCENITVANCLLTSRSCAIKIGSENMDTIRNVVFNNCIISNSNRGIGIQNRDEGVVENVLFSNMIIEGRLFSDVWWGKAEPIYVTAYRRAMSTNKDASMRFPDGALQGRVGKICNIYFTNIKCNSENGVYVSGESLDKIDNIVFDNVDVHIDKTTTFPGGIYDRRPAEVEGFVKGKTAGFYFDRAGKITVRNCSVTWGEHKPAYYGDSLYQNKVRRLIWK